MPAPAQESLYSNQANGQDSGILTIRCICQWYLRHLLPPPPAAGLPRSAEENFIIHKNFQLGRLTAFNYPVKINKFEKTFHPAYF
jgi:hypothetical protein